MNEHIEVKRTSSAGDYGPWMSAADEDVPRWVGELAADEMIESKKDCGQVDQGGSVWLFRRAD